MLNVLLITPIFGEVFPSSPEIATTFPWSMEIVRQKELSWVRNGQQAGIAQAQGICLLV